MEKITEAGDFFTVLTIEKNPYKKFDKTFLKEKKSMGRNGNASPEEKVKNRKAAVRKAKFNIINLVNANFKEFKVRGFRPKYVVMTYKKNVQDWVLVKNDFNKFIKRVEWHVKRKVKKLEYLCAIELQRRGAVHFNVIFFNMPYVYWKDLIKLWGFGSVVPQELKDVDNVGAYVCEYFTKDIEKLAGVRCYRKSRGLVKPRIYRGAEARAIKAELEGYPEKVCYFRAWDGGEFGACSNKQFKGVELDWRMVRIIKRCLEEEKAPLKGRRKIIGWEDYKNAGRTAAKVLE
jgi:adenylate kinase family enzyme